MFQWMFQHTVIRRINVLGMEAQNEPLTLSDFNEYDWVTSVENLIGIGSAVFEI